MGTNIVFYLGTCNYMSFIFLDVPNFFHNQKTNTSKSFLLSSGLRNFQVDIIYFLTFL